MKVRIQTIGGRYESDKAWEGELSKAPTTVLIPEGIESARTTSDAKELVAIISEAIRGVDQIVISASRWQIRVQRIASEAR